MSEALTVHSHFEDVAELAAGLADRVEEGRVILYGPTNYEAGAKIPFAVLLADGSPVIEGQGVVAASVDGGEERPPEIRYDVVLTDLEMDARSEIMFSRILMAGESASSEVALPEDDGGFEQVDVSAGAGEDLDMGGFQDESTAVADLSAHAAAMMPAAAAAEPKRESAPGPAAQPAPKPEPAAAPQPEPQAPVSTTVEPEAFSVTTGKFVDGAAPSEPAADDDDDAYGDERSVSSTGASTAVSVGGAMAPPVAPPPPPGFVVQRLADVGLSRPVHAATWWPEPSPRPAPEPSSGAFVYTGALPIPNQPPRPNLDPSQRVSPAPHPMQEGSAPAAAARSARSPVDAHAATYAAGNDSPADFDAGADDVDFDME